MKTLLLVLAAAGLTGCAVYPAPAYESYGAVAPPVYAVEQPTYFYGGGSYRHGGFPHAYPEGYRRFPPGAFTHPPRGPGVYAPRPGYGMRDRDGDGIPNRHDRWPGNPWRR